MGSEYFNLIQNWALCVQVIQAKVEGNKHKNILITLFFFFLSKKDQLMLTETTLF